MKGFYNVIETIKDELLASPFINTVTYGDISEVDLAKKTIFPLGHFMVDTVTYTSQTLTFEINMLVMDIVDFNKEEQEDNFITNGNEQDILNTQLQVVTNVLDKLSIGNLYTSKYQLTGEPQLQAFVDRFDNILCGWAVTVSIQVENTNAIC